MTYPATAQLESPIRARFDTTSRAVDAADQAHVRQALESVGWERRGLFQRLTRRPLS